MSAEGGRRDGRSGREGETPRPAGRSDESRGGVGPAEKGPGGRRGVADEAGAGGGAPDEGAGGRGRALVVMPTYQERRNLPQIVPAILEEDERLDVLVVDDDSPDGTGEAAEELAAREARVHVMHRKRKLGLGSAYRDGFRWGLQRGFDYLLEMDADFSHDPAYLPELLDAAGDEYDLVAGSRYLEGVNVINWPMGRLLLSWFANKYARWITGLPVTDSTSGFKCFRREVLEAVDFDRVETTGYAFQIEMSFRAWRMGFRVGEIPIVFVDREIGESKMSGAIVWEAVWKVWELRLRALLGLL